MTRIHAHDGSLIAEYARERRIFVPINTIPKRVIAAFLSAEDRRFYEHGGLDFQGIGPRRLQAGRGQDPGQDAPRRGRLHHHPAGRQELPADQRAHHRAQDQGGDPRHPHRARLPQGQDPRALPQRDLPRHRRLRRGRRQPQLLQQGAEGPDDRGGGLPRRAAQGAQQLPSVPPDQGGDRAAATGSSARWPRTATSPREEAEAAKAKPLGVNFRPGGAHIFAAEYFAEEVRRTLLADYGEEKLYSGGLSVRTTLDPRLQQIGAHGADRRPRRVRPQARAGAAR